MPFNESFLEGAGQSREVRSEDSRRTRIPAEPGQEPTSTVYGLGFRVEVLGIRAWGSVIYDDSLQFPMIYYTIL